MAGEREQPRRGSFLLLDEYYAAGNDSFLDELCAITESKKLAGFVDRWKNDPRPWARERIFDYLDRPMTTPGHNVVVKRLYKQAEQKRDTQVIAAFVHAIDVLVRRARKTRYQWDWNTRESWTEEVLVTPRDALLPTYGPKKGKLFSYRTRYYLRRRAWRYIRRLGFQRPQDYVGAAAGALARYTDADFAKGEHILDSWCLLSICYRKSEALAFGPNHVRLAEGSSLNDLTPAPKFLKLWQEFSAGEVLWNLLAVARSKLVRVWCMQMLREHQAEFVRGISPDKLLPLFESSDDQVQQFAAALLEASAELPRLPIKSWLKLLETKNPSALATICQLMLKYVTADRLDLQQLISMTTSAPAPVANLGLAFLKRRPIASAADRLAVSELAAAQCEAVAGNIAAYGLSVVGAKEVYDVTLVARFFDALLKPTRVSAWAWLTPECAGYSDAALWSRLIETPYEDVRLNLVTILQERAKLPGAGIDELVPVWTAVLLGIHRGGRHKIKALHQISRAISEHPEAAEKLLPVIAVAIRSVRPAEARVGIAAVVQAVEQNGNLREPASRVIGELQFVSEGATA
jgi:hypothetical protein